MTNSSKKEAILTTATALFAEHGYHAIGIDRIIAESKVAKMTLYKHFPSKEILIENVLSRRDQQLRESILKYLEPHHTDIGKLKAIFDWYEAWLQSSDFHGCMFIKAAEEYSDIDATMRKISKNHKLWLRDLIQSLIANIGCSSPQALATHLLTVLDGLTVAANLFRDSEMKLTQQAWEYARQLVAQASTTEAAV